MLCLRQKICRHIPGIGRLICDHQNLAWPCDGINAVMSIDRFFSQRYIDIPRAYDLIHLRDGFRPVSQRADRLGSSHLINYICSGFLCRHQCIGRNLSIFPGRRDHNNFFYTGHPGRNNIHQHRRRVRCLSSRHIDAYSLKCRHLLSQDRPVRLCVKPASLHLFFMIGTNIPKRFFYHPNQRRICQAVGFFDLLVRDTDCTFINLCMVKLHGIGKQSLISLLPDLVKDLRNTLFKFVVLIRTTFQKILQQILPRLLFQFHYSHRNHSRFLF